MEPRLQQTQTQRMLLTPQMRQYLRLLQLPVMELRTVIEQELAENPVLEEVTKGLEESPPSSPSQETKEERGTDELRFDETLRSLDRLDEESEGGFSGPEDLSLPELKDIQSKKDYQEALITRKESLFDYLLWQITFLDLNPTETKIAEEIVGSLTEDGFLGCPVEEIVSTCGVSGDQAEKVLRAIQNLDPPGIAARNLQETLLLQLQRKGAEAELALKIVQDYFPLLEKKPWDLIGQQLKVAREEIDKAARLIARLDPKPGRTFYSEDPIAITPDAEISPDESGNGKLRIEVYDEEIPEIRVSPYYRKLLKNPKLDAESRRFLKEKIQSAIDFVKALSQRRSTLRAITEAIVKAQPEFLEKGFAHLKPLRLKDISEKLGIHESTVSRALQGKYVSTPQGTLLYKSFFSSRLERVEGGVESQKSMMEKIRELIRSEDPRNPLSDEEIARRFQREGIRIARRTVAKYRELLKILPSHLRRKK